MPVYYKLPTRAPAERGAKFVEPVGKDGGAQFNLNIQATTPT
jgi:hypothetical protein